MSAFSLTHFPWKYRYRLRVIRFIVWSGMFKVFLLLHFIIRTGILKDFPLNTTICRRNLSLWFLKNPALSCFSVTSMKICPKLLQTQRLEGWILNNLREAFLNVWLLWSTSKFSLCRFHTASLFSDFADCAFQDVFELHKFVTIGQENACPGSIRQECVVVGESGQQGCDFTVFLPSSEVDAALHLLIEVLLCFLIFCCGSNFSQTCYHDERFIKRGAFFRSWALYVTNSAEPTSKSDSFHSATALLCITFILSKTVTEGIDYAINFLLCVLGCVFPVLDLARLSFVSAFDRVGRLLSAISILQFGISPFLTAQSKWVQQMMRDAVCLQDDIFLGKFTILRNTSQTVVQIEHLSDYNRQIYCIMQMRLSLQKRWWRPCSKVSQTMTRVR